MYTQSSVNASVCMHVYMHVKCTYVWTPEVNTGCLLLLLSTLFLEGLSLKLDLTRLAGQKIPGMFLSLSS